MLPNLVSIAVPVWLLAFRPHEVSGSYEYREYDLEGVYTTADRQYYKNAIFPTIQGCKKRDDIIVVQVKLSEPSDLGDEPEGDGPSLTEWSSLLDKFLFETDGELDDDPEYQKLMEQLRNDPHYTVVTLGIVVLVALFVLFVLIGFIVIPPLGYICAMICLVCYTLLSYPIRKTGRYLIIHNELWKRKRERYLFPNVLRKRGVDKSYRVPKFFREYSDESEPEVLRLYNGKFDKDDERAVGARSQADVRSGSESRQRNTLQTVAEVAMVKKWKRKALGLED